MKVRKGEYPTLTQTRFYNIILYVWYRRKSVQRHLKFFCPIFGQLFWTNYVSLEHKVKYYRTTRTVGVNRNENSWLEVAIYLTFRKTFRMYLSVISILTQNISIQNIPISYAQNTQLTFIYQQNISLMISSLPPLIISHSRA